MPRTAKELQQILDESDFRLVEVLNDKDDEQACYEMRQRFVREYDAYLKFEKDPTEIQRNIDTIDAFLELKMLEARVQDVQKQREKEKEEQEEQEKEDRNDPGGVSLV